MLNILNKFMKKKRKKANTNSLNTRLLRIVLLLGVASFLHVVSIVYFEKVSYSDALWLTVTTLTTTGYGDISAHSSLGRVSTVVFIYCFGIYALAHAADIFLTKSQEKLELIRIGKWRWKLKNHILIIGSPRHGASVYFDRLIQQIKETDQLKNHDIQILFEDQQAFSTVEDVITKHKIFHCVGEINNGQSIQNVNAANAAFVIVLAKDDKDSDACSFDLISRIRDVNSSAFIVAESIDDNNVSRFKKIGANSVIRPMRTYPEMIIRSIIAPGSEEVIINLFDAKGEQCVRFDLDRQMLSKWGEIILKSVMSDFGLPIGYIDHDGVVYTNPSPKKMVHMKAILMLISEDSETTREDVLGIIK